MSRQLMKIMCGMLTVATVGAVFTGCGKAKTTPTTTTEPYDSYQMMCEPMELDVFDIENKDIFEEGYCVVQVDLEYLEEQEVHCRRGWSDSVDWYLYVFDEELEEVSLEILSDMEPTITNEGKLVLKQGQWLYIVCSCNATNSEEPIDCYYCGTYFGP